MQESFPMAPAPVNQARLGGALYLAIIMLGLFTEVFVRGRLVAAGGMAAAANLRNHEMLWRWGIAAGLVSILCVTVFMLIWFNLLKPVSRDLALLAVFFALMSHTIEAMGAVDLMKALSILRSADCVAAFTPEQLAAAAKLTVRSQGFGFGLSLLFTGCIFLILGRLIFLSGYLPRTIGVLYQIAGVGYLSHAFTLILAPLMAGYVFLVSAGPILVAESSFALYLLVKGVNIDGWNQRQKILARTSRSQS